MAQTPTRLTHRQQEQASANIQTAALVSFLQKHTFKGRRTKMDPTRVKAAEILLARTLPVLSAVDQTIHNPDDALSDDDLRVQLTELMLAHPDIVREVLGVIEASKRVVADSQQVAVQQTVDTAVVQTPQTSIE